VSDPTTVAALGAGLVPAVWSQGVTCRNALHDVALRDAETAQSGEGLPDRDELREHECRRRRLLLASIRQRLRG